MTPNHFWEAPRNYAVFDPTIKQIISKDPLLTEFKNFTYKLIDIQMDLNSNFDVCSLTSYAEQRTSWILPISNQNREIMFTVGIKIFYLPALGKKQNERVRVKSAIKKTAKNHSSFFRTSSLLLSTKLANESGKIS